MLRDWPPDGPTGSRASSLEYSPPSTHVPPPPKVKMSMKDPTECRKKQEGRRVLGRARRRCPSLSSLLGMLQDTVAMAGLGNPSMSKNRQQDAQREGGTKWGGGWCDEISVEGGANECSTFTLVNVMFNSLKCMFRYTWPSSTSIYLSHSLHLILSLFSLSQWFVPLMYLWSAFPFYVLLISQSIDSAHCRQYSNPQSECQTIFAPRHVNIYYFPSELREFSVVAGGPREGTTQRSQKRPRHNEAKMYLESKTRDFATMHNSQRKYVNVYNSASRSRSYGV